MSSVKQLTAGRLNGVIYDFARGESLPMHRHGEEDVHITIVARGRVRAHGLEFDDIHEAGAVIDWPVGLDHEIVAEVDGSRIINILKN
jgi:quercetin dioxygenase-like cupin family protein